MAPEFDAWRFAVCFDPGFLVCVFVWFGFFPPWCLWKHSKSWLVSGTNITFYGIILKKGFVRLVKHSRALLHLQSCGFLLNPNSSLWGHSFNNFTFCFQAGSLWRKKRFLVMLHLKHKGSFVGSSLTWFLSFIFELLPKFRIFSCDKL